MIPGFRVHVYELYGTMGLGNKSVFNPYNHEHNTNLIGDSIDREEQHTGIWNEISELLISCKYKQPKYVTSSKPNELNVLSLNIRSLAKHITTISDNIAEYQKYDVMCFNEANCNVDTLAHGIDD